MAIYRSIRRVTRKYVKPFAKLAYNTARKRYIKKGRLNMRRLGKDVLMLKSMVNAEKKHVGPLVYIEPISTTNIFPVGLTNGTGEGLQMINITPQLLKGNNRDNRNGNSIKLHSGCLHMNFAGQSAQSNNSLIKIEIYAVNNTLYGVTPTPNVFGSDLFKQDPITNRYSSNCSRNPNYFKRFTLLKSMTFRTPQDNAGSSNFIKQITMPLRFRNRHVRWDDQASGQGWTDGEIFLVVRSNNGNASTTVASSAANTALNLNTAVNTGFQFQLYTDFYYYDN